METHRQRGMADSRTWWIASRVVGVHCSGERMSRRGRVVGEGSGVPRMLPMGLMRMSSGRAGVRRRVRRRRVDVGAGDGGVGAIEVGEWVGWRMLEEVEA